MIEEQVYQQETYNLRLIIRVSDNFDDQFPQKMSNGWIFRNLSNAYSRQSLMRNSDKYLKMMMKSGGPTQTP